MNARKPCSVCLFAYPSLRKLSLHEIPRVLMTLFICCESSDVRESTRQLAITSKWQRGACHTTHSSHLILPRVTFHNFLSSLDFLPILPTLTITRTGYSSHHPPPSAHSIQSDRPNLAHRTSSYSKRHASFDTPREVPLPFMQPRRPQQSSYPSSNSNSHGVPPVSTGTILPEGEYGSAAHMNSSGAVLDARGVPYGSRLDGPPCSSNIPPATPLTRPQMDSRRASSSSRRMDTREDTILPPTSSQRSGSGQQQRLIQRASSGAVPLFGRPFSSPMGPATNSTQTPDRICSPAPVRPATRNSTASLPSPMNTPYSTLQTHSGSTIHEGQEMRMDPETRPPSAASHRSRRRPLPQPPALPQYSSSPPPYSPAQPLRSAFLNADARSDITATSSTYSSYPRTADPFADRHHRDRDRSVTSSTASLASASGSGFAPPAPPTVLSPTPVDHGRDSRSAAHNSFLSQSSPTREVYIAVETLAREYKLVVRLPGYRRDSITLSTRKRRILHLVADSWEPEGGHFERRISFGYDAELSQIRAEFDGDFLKVIVPRRAAPVTYWGSSRD